MQPSSLFLHNRRTFLGKSALCLGTLDLGSLLKPPQAQAAGHTGTLLTLPLPQ